jgi:hypothetical protein
MLTTSTLLFKLIAPYDSYIMALVDYNSSSSSSSPPPPTPLRAPQSTQTSSKHTSASDDIVPPASKRCATCTSVRRHVDRVTLTAYQDGSFPHCPEAMPLVSICCHLASSTHAAVLNPDPHQATRKMIRRNIKVELGRGRLCLESIMHTST